MENLIQRIKSITLISENVETAIRKVFKKELFQKKAILLREGQYCRKLYFMDKGLVRTYFSYKDKDVSTFFYSENLFFTSSYSFYSQAPSFEYIEALEDSQVYSIGYDDYQKLMTDFPTFGAFGRIYAEQQLAYIDFYQKGYAFMTAQEKYFLLLEMFPGIELRVKLGYIASFLGVSQETLSRIRGQKR